MSRQVSFSISREIDEAFIVIETVYGLSASAILRILLLDCSENRQPWLVAPPRSQWAAILGRAELRKRRKRLSFFANTKIEGAIRTITLARESWNLSAILREIISERLLLPRSSE